MSKAFWVWLITIIFMFLSWGIAFVADVRSSVYTADLVLADDASTPEKKAEYLNKFIKKAKAKPIAEYGAFFYKNSRSNVQEQIQVLESLKKRCDDLKGLNKESMGYSQGMTQITGQEFTHAIDNIKTIFKIAYELKYFGIFLITWWWWSWFIPVVIGILLIVRTIRNI